ncbi:MAG: helicase C-terminal domain-containing protein [Candidatus Nitrosopolaris sp.]
MGYRHIILEAPAGFGKSPVAIATALTLGSSYILTSTKNLQTQYARDFPFVRIAKGKNNFRCEVKDDFIKNHTFSKPTVLISPSLHLGLDLKDDLSRFQIITKVPYPSLGDRWIDEKRKRSEKWYNWQTALRLVQGYGRSIRSKDDWAKTYVLDSAFGPFVRKNKNILPNWFIQAIQSDLNVPTGQSRFDIVQVFTTSKEDNTEATDNHHSQANISKNEISSYIPSEQLGTLASLDSYNKNKNNRPEPSFICPYCSKFSSTLEKEYQRHIVLKHPGKSGYPNMAAVG